MIKKIVFDWHGVLDLTTFEKLINLIVLKSGTSNTEVVNFFMNIKESLLRGERSYLSVIRDLKIYFDIPDQELNLIKKYGLSIDKDEFLFSRIKELKHYYSFAILSDCFLEKSKYIKKMIDLSDFEAISFSCDLGLTKSQDSFFLSVLSGTSLLNSEILYVDDTMRHVDRAKSLGFNTYHFKDSISLYQVLLDLDQYRL